MRRVMRLCILSVPPMQSWLIWGTTHFAVAAPHLSASCVHPMVPCANGAMCHCQTP